MDWTLDPVATNLRQYVFLKNRRKQQQRRDKLKGHMTVTNTNAEADLPELRTASSTEALEELTKPGCVPKCVLCKHFPELSKPPVPRHCEPHCRPLSAVQRMRQEVENRRAALRRPLSASPSMQPESRDMTHPPSTIPSAFKEAARMFRCATPSNVPSTSKKLNRRRSPRPLRPSVLHTMERLSRPKSPAKQIRSVETTEGQRALLSKIASAMGAPQREEDKHIPLNASCCAEMQRALQFRKRQLAGRLEASRRIFSLDAALHLAKDLPM